MAGTIAYDWGHLNARVMKRYVFEVARRDAPGAVDCAATIRKHAKRD